ncbi:PREDICTED: tRNA wybutosine-synthesizing protein 3 homolog [Tinamus guttatus]|nr:PREDICTED: tRNA wybutosine-synthesizing protein 3 homolog [Tinamus guttatus]
MKAGTGLASAAAGAVSERALRPWRTRCRTRHRVHRGHNRSAPWHVRSLRLLDAARRPRQPPRSCGPSGFVSLLSSSRSNQNEAAWCPLQVDACSYTLPVFIFLRVTVHIFSININILCLFQMTALEEVAGDVVFKFEPFVLHVLCRELQDAQLLHSAAIDSGFRNSGITVGKKGKIVMAVRSTHCLEVPLSHMGKLMVSEEYIEFLIQTANQKMEENMRRIDRFYNCLQLALKTAPDADDSPSEEREKNHDVYVRRRKRETVQKRGACTSPGDHSEELEQEDDPEGNVDIFGEITE